MNNDPIRELITLHARVIESGFNYAYFELASTRTTDWMAWLCTDARELNPNRIILATGQGNSPDTACALALESYPMTVHKAWLDEKLTNQQAESLVDLRRFAPQQNL